MSSSIKLLVFLARRFTFGVAEMVKTDQQLAELHPRRVQEPIPELPSGVARGVCRAMGS